MTLQDNVMYYTACAYCGVAVSNVRVREGSDFSAVRARVACPDCYAEWQASRDSGAPSETASTADAERVSVSNDQTY